VQAAAAAKFADAPDQPTIRVVTGLGNTELVDYRVDLTVTTNATVPMVD
jgi:hypothetical protein